MAYTKEQCCKEFQDALKRLESLLGLEKLREVDETFDVDAVIRRFLDRNDPAECRTIGSRALAISNHLAEFTYAIKSEHLLDLAFILRPILNGVLGLYDRITQCEGFRDVVIDQLWMRPLPTTQPGLLMSRALIAAYDHARMSSDKPLPSAQELIERQKTREMLSNRPGATITRTESGFTCVVPGRQQ